MSLDAWKAKALHEITLPSGTVVEIRLPDITDCVIAGDIPMPILDSMKDLGEGVDPTSEQLGVFRRYRAELIKAAVRSVDGEAASLTDADVASIPEDDAEAVFDYAARNKPLPNQG